MVFIPILLTNTTFLGEILPILQIVVLFFWAFCAFIFVATDLTFCQYRG